MSNYRDRYIARGIPDFDPAACAPYPVGQVPQSGWYLIEPAGTYTIPVPDTSIAPGKRWDVDEVIDEAALQAICESYDPAINGGNGIQVNNDHLHLRTTGDNPALGWCKALDYGRVDGSLYQAAYIAWVKDTHHDLNQGKYWAFSRPTISASTTTATARRACPVWPSPTTRTTRPSRASSANPLQAMWSSTAAVPPSPKPQP